MARAQPVASIVADPATPQPLRERLLLAGSIREYAARELKLPDSGSYRSYADIGRPYVVWNVVAAPEFSTKPVESCFPVAGCVPYRGFFSKDGAERHAERLRAEGNDTNLRGVRAYSTLGRFNDPLLSTYIHDSDAELARLIFHELAHQLLYVKGDSTFNESFAVTVEEAGVLRWLAATGREAQLPAHFRTLRRRAEFFDLLDQARDRLDALYRLRIAPEEMRERKREEMALLKANVVKLGPPTRFAAVEPNNALLASYTTYTQLVPAFERLLQEEGGDLEKFYARVKILSANERSNRGPLSAPSR